VTNFNLTMDVLGHCYAQANLPDVIRFSREGNVELLAQSLDLGLSPDTPDADRRRTGLHHAASRGLHVVMTMLLEAGADPNFQDIRGNTPLHLCGHKSTLTLLMQYRADPHLHNTMGIKASHMMQRRGVAKEILNELKQYEIEYEYEAEEEFAISSGESDGLVLRQRRTVGGNEQFPLLMREAKREELHVEDVQERLLPDAHTPVRGNDGVFTIIGSCRRPFSHSHQPVLHEFFLSMDLKTFLVFVFCLFCLALLTALYITGAQLNYFGWISEEDFHEKPVDVETLQVIGENDENVRIVPIRFN